ncbi:ATP phosphoribosyltransferase [Alphaproteobacteria bacterium]|jgi:ATP phosphoribosyltransferase|nr:ATP phosphoribosyltransferase [Alphaproteobacteria bacterium]
MTASTDKLILAVPKGRILDQVMPVFEQAGLIPEPAFFESGERRLRFATNHANLDIVRVRSFDVATFLAYGAAHLGVAGSDVIAEFSHPEIYAPVDLNIGICRMVVACSAEFADAEDPKSWSHVRVATKYPSLTKNYFAKRGVQAECIKLNGAMELAPQMGLCRRIVDLVETGSTLKANGLVELETIAQVSSRLVVNRTAWKQHPEMVDGWISRLRAAARQAAE